MLDIDQFRTEIVRPTLHALDAHSQAAENLVIGTAVQESRLHYLTQLGNGPARGVFQMEPSTHDDIWNNFLAYRDPLRGRVEEFLVRGKDRHDQLVWNLAYATAMCRVHYLRAPAALPGATDVSGLAAYWKEYYNTEQGKGTVAEFTEKYIEFVSGNASAD